MQVLGIKTDLVRPGDDLVDSLERAMKRSNLSFEDGDILVVSESIVATAEGRVVLLDDVEPSEVARALAARYGKDPQEMELIIRESDEIVGGIPGVVLTMNRGFLFPNAGIDNSNAPPGHVVLFPADAERSAKIIKEKMAGGKKIGVIIGDSRTHPLRLGCVGVALACCGLEAVEDARGQKDLFGRELKITRKAVADNLVSAAQIVMGEGDEGVPAAIIRGSSVPMKDGCSEIPTIPPSECMYIGALGFGPRPYAGGYDQLIKKASLAMIDAYAPYSHFKVGAALLTKGGRIYSAGNIENASTGVGICAERAAMVRAISSGDRAFEAIAIVGDADQPVSPCGICRQCLIEFGEDIVVIMANSRGDALIAASRDLLPNAFTGRCWNRLLE